MSTHGYYDSQGHGSNYIPKSDNINGNSIFKNSSYSNKQKFNEDALNDFRRWVKKFEKDIDIHAENKYLYEKEKELKIEDKETRREMKLDLSDSKGFLEDMRKGFDWYIDNFGREPFCYRKMVKNFSIELKRLKRLKKYLSYRVRSLAGKGLYNEPSKDILKFIRIKIKTINILFDPKYNERTPLEEIYGLTGDENEDVSLDGINTNKLFYPYD